MMADLVEGRRRLVRLTPASVAIAALAFCWIGLAAVWATPAVFTIDGLIYHAMIDAFARGGSLFVENGYDEYGSDALRLSLLRIHDGNLVPQYPGGWGIMAAPAYLLGGIRGVILLNATAAALTLPLIWVTARALLQSEALATCSVLIYGLATFAVDYAFGVWPHAVTTFLVTAAVAAVVTGWRAGPAAEMRGALAAGLVLGVGINVRVDAVFAAVPIALWLLAAGRRPYSAFGLLAAGLVPGLAAAAAINHAKFGVFSPATYGTDVGNANVGHFARLAPLAAIFMAVALASGSQRIRARLYRPATLWAALAAGLLVIAAVPPLRGIVASVFSGLWILVVDFQAYPMPAYGAAVLEDGTFRMFGMTKKALLQSVPYAAAAIVLAPRLCRGPDRAPLAFCFLFVALGIMPFAYNAWHGGMANNMRYFLNVLPVVAILAAAAFCETRMMAQGRSALALASVLAVSAIALLHAAVREYPLGFLLQSTLPNALALATAFLAVLVLVTAGAMRSTIATMLRGVFLAGLATAFVSAWYIDLAVSQTVRARNLAVGELTATVPANALVVSAFPERVGVRLNRPPALTAEARFPKRRIDPDLLDLVRRAVAEGRPVFAHGRFVAEQLVTSGVATDLESYGGDGDLLEFYRILPAISRDAARSEGRPVNP